MPGMSPVHDPERSPRSDGEASRERLLRAGLNLFARQGYAKTSTRELAEAAGVNVASISYYFGDKAGLYRAVFFEPLGEIADDIAAFSDAQLSIEEALRVFYAGFLEPLSQGEDGQLCVKLRMREMLEPTGLWAEEIDQGIRPMHEALLKVLCRHLGVAQPDDPVARHRVAALAELEPGPRGQPADRDRALLAGEIALDAIDIEARNQRLHQSAVINLPRADTVHQLLIIFELQPFHRRI